MISDILVIGVVGLSALVLGLLLVIFKMLKTIKAYKKQLEKLSVNNDTSSGRVEVLEAKIKTLEAALQKALNK